MTDAVFRGVGVALVTLFDEQLGVDAAGTAALAQRIVDGGVSTVVVAGTTGEAPALEAAERAPLIEAVLAAVRPMGATIVAGTGAPSARQAVRFTADAVDRGVDAVLALSPPGGDPRPYYEEIAAAAGSTPVLGYHYPAVSPPGIPVAMLGELPIAGCKDSTGDAGRLLETMAVWDGHVYVGSSSLAAMAGAVGATGAILAMANADPERCVAAFAGDWQAQRALGAIRGATTKELTAQRWGVSPRARI